MKFGNLRLLFLVYRYFTPKMTVAMSCHFWNSRVSRDIFIHPRAISSRNWSLTSWVWHQANYYRFKSNQCRSLHQRIDHLRSWCRYVDRDEPVPLATHPWKLSRLPCRSLRDGNLRNGSWHRQGYQALASWIPLCRKDRLCLSRHTSQRLVSSLCCEWEREEWFDAPNLTSMTQSTLGSDLRCPSRRCEQTSLLRLAPHPNLCLSNTSGGQGERRNSVLIHASSDHTARRDPLYLFLGSARCSIGNHADP